LLIPKSRDRVRLNPGIRESRDPGIAIPSCSAVVAVNQELFQNRVWRYSMVELHIR